MKNKVKIMLFSAFILFLSACDETLHDEFASVAPVFKSASYINIDENEIFVVDLDIFDVTAFTLTLGGMDAASFNIQGTRLFFNEAPQFGKKSVYSLSVTATNQGQKSTTQNITVRTKERSILDSDNDYIPDDIEILLGMDPNHHDENNNGILDGLESNAPFGDQFFDKQWHIRSLGAQTNDSNVSTMVGNDLNVLEIYHRYMGYNGGNPIIIQVVDSGVDIKHEDLKDNIDLSRSYNGEEVGDPVAEHWHGTTVAGIIAARAFNGVGVRGIIPFAKIAGSNWMEHQTYEGLEKAWLSGEGANEIAVTNNSWGAYFEIDTMYEKIMQLGTATLRDNKGRIYVFSAGNEREEFGNANLSYIINNRFAIAVAALKHDNTYAPYSSPGSNVLVSGYAGDNPDNSPTISTTFIEGESSNSGDTKTTWSEDTKQNYTFIMSGTSAATPTVTASIALVLEACPDVSWRDVKYLVAKNARIVDADNASWVKNSAGLSHSIDYGYGLINPRDMIKECLSNSYAHLPSEKKQTLSKTFNIEIPDNGENATSFELEILENSINVEWVEVIIDSNSTYASDYEISLISPNKTKTTLMTAGNLVSGAEEHQEDWMVGNFEHATAGWMQGGFRFSSAAMIDETSKGIWRVQIRDTKAGHSGSVKSIELTIYGH